MVARITTGTSIGNVLEYNEKKVELSQAKLIYAGGFPKKADDLSLEDKKAVFSKLTSQNIRVKTNAIHITLNFSPEDQLSPSKLTQIGRDYMKGIGFARQPVLIYQHLDAAHPHIHMATVTIMDGGKRIPTHNIALYKSRELRKILERNYNLIRVEDVQQRRLAAAAQEVGEAQVPVKLERVPYSSVGTRDRIFAVVDEVVKSYKYTSLKELNAVLRQFGVVADGGRPGSKMHARGGLIYGLLDDQNKRVGSAINASLVKGRPTLYLLRKLYMQHGEDRRLYSQRIKSLVEAAMYNSSSQAQVAKALNADGIRVVFSKDGKGRVYAVHFIDNAARVVFDGRDLGEKFSASQFLKGLQAKPANSLNKRPAVSGVSMAQREGRVVGTHHQASRRDIDLAGSLRAGHREGDSGQGLVGMKERLKEAELEQRMAERQLLRQDAGAGPRPNQRAVHIAADGVGKDYLVKRTSVPGTELPVIQFLTDTLHYGEDEVTRQQRLAQAQAERLERRMAEQQSLRQDYGFRL